MPKGVCGTRGLPTVLANLTAWQVASVKAAEMAMSKFGMKCADYAKAEHRWQNRTGLAEAGLGSFTFPAEGTAIQTDVYHGVTWGVYLETRPAFDGRYQILDESILANFPSLMADLRAIFISGSGLNVAFATPGWHP